jgi:hypothetical protein
MGTKSPQPATGGGGREGGAFAFISKGWREARDSATADLSLMRERADRELAHLIAASASALAGPGTASRPFAELDLVRRRIQPKITELRNQCSSTVLEGWPPKAGAGASLRVDLSGLTAIRNAILADGRLRVAPWKGDKGRAEWDVVAMVRSGLKEFERRSLLSSEMLGGFRGRSEFLDKLKLSLVNSTMAFNNGVNRTSGPYSFSMPSLKSFFFKTARISPKTIFVAHARSYFSLPRCHVDKRTQLVKQTIVAKDFSIGLGRLCSGRVPGDRRRRPSCWPR